MSELQDAINVLLVARGVTPIIDPASGHPDVQAARALLYAHKKEVNGQKRWYNTETADLAPDVDGFIKLPASVVGLDVDANNVIMDGKLYNVADRTNIYTEAVEDLVLIYDRDWPDLPTQAYAYIVATAKEEFIRSLESQILTAQAEKDIVRAKALFDIAEYRFQDPAKETANPLMLKWRTKMLVR